MKLAHWGIVAASVALYVIAPFKETRPGVASAAQEVSRSTAAQSLDFEFYRARVEPIFLERRSGHPRCYSCHKAAEESARVIEPGFVPNAGIKSGTVAVSAASFFHLEWLSPGSTSWTEEQSRRNFAHVATLVTPGNPGKSLLLMHPLAPEAGGDPRHGGGSQFTSEDDPDWQIMAQWVRSGSAGGPAPQAASASTTGSSLDFQVYRTRIEPIFLKEREGGVMCYNCHSVLNTPLRLERLSAGSAFWTEEQSRLNFEVVSKLVSPGEPVKSRFLLHPLAPEAGGDLMHTGGKFWKSQNDPEWQMIADWVRSGSGGVPAAQAVAPSAEPPSLDFEFYRTRVEPVFLERRPGHPRCYSCHKAAEESARVIERGFVPNAGIKSGTVAVSAASFFHLEWLSPGSTSWTEEQSRRNFEHVSTLVTPGNPGKSLLLMHPLAPEAGGDPRHGGGSQFTSEDDPDWQAMMQWVRGQKAGRQ